MDTERYVARYAARYCRDYARCDPDEYDYYYQGKRALCRDDIETRLGDYAEDQGCTVEPEAAEACLSGLRGVPCENFHQGSGDLEVCSEVWICEDS